MPEEFNKNWQKKPLLVMHAENAAQPSGEYGGALIERPCLSLIHFFPEHPCLAHSLLRLSSTLLKRCDFKINTLFPG